MSTVPLTAATPCAVTIEFVRDAVRRVREEFDKDRNDEAHWLEDQLHQAVLKHIADNSPPDASALAAEALKTLEIDRQRWYE